MSAEVANPPMEAVASSNNKKDLATLALVVGLVTLGLAFIGLMQGWRAGDSRPFLGWMIGLSYWLSMGIGMLFLLMILYVFDAGWSIVVRRQLEHAISGLKWIGLIFLPVIALSFFYPENNAVPWVWMDPTNITPHGEPVGGDILHQSKSGFLNVGFFTLRTIFYFAVWIGLAGLLRRCSFSMEKDGDPKWSRLAHNVSAVGIYLCALCATFAAVDWFKSLEYHWFSTMYGVWFFAESMRAGLAGTMIICWILGTRGYLKGIYNRYHSYLLACLMLAFTVFWAYISFSQYFLIYNANIPEETFWYSIREINFDGSKNSWWWVSMALVFAHFLFPFLYLLWYHNKFGLRVIFISVWILVFHGFDIYWNILPGQIPSDENLLGFTVRPFMPHWVDILTMIGVGCICMWSFIISSRKVKSIPIRDPRIIESLNAHE